MIMRRRSLDEVGYGSPNVGADDEVGYAPVEQQQIDTSAIPGPVDDLCVFKRRSIACGPYRDQSV